MRARGYLFDYFSFHITLITVLSVIQCLLGFMAKYGCYSVYSKTYRVSVILPTALLEATLGILYRFLLWKKSRFVTKKVEIIH